MTIAVFSPKFQSDVPAYTQVNMTLINEKLAILGRETLLKSGIAKDIIDIEGFVNKLGGQKFLQDYANAIAQMLTEILESDPTLPSNFFDIDSDNWLPMTELTEAQALNGTLDQVIATIRASIKTAFPENNFSPLHKLMSISSNQDFLSQFATTVGQHLNDPMWENIGALHGAIKSLSGAYQDLKDPNKDTAQALKDLNGNLKTVWAQIIWERISLNAKIQVINKLMEEIGQDIILPEQRIAIGTVSIKITGKQTGAKKSQQKEGEKKSGGKQEVSDSVVTIQITNKNNLKVEIEIGDSTKFTQNPSSGGFKINATTQQSEVHSLGELLASVRRRTYWEKRLSAFLDKPGKGAKGLTQTTNDIDNWRNTYEGFYRLALYDVMAKRATTSGTMASTFTINDKVKMISTLIVDIPQSDIFRRADKEKNDIFQLGKGYDQYVNDQLKISKGYTHDEESQLRQQYLTYINQILNTKIDISRNVSYAAVSGKI